MSQWEAVNGAEAGRLEAELRREVGRDHSLRGRTWRAVARRRDCDDVAFEVAPGGLCVVHLTWARGASEPSWPKFTFVDALPDDGGEPRRGGLQSEPMAESRHPGAIELLVGFEIGLYTREDVGAWVDVEVERRDAVTGPLLELTTLSGKHDVDIERLLRELAGGPDAKAEAAIGLAVLGERLRRKQVTCRDAIRQAARLAEAISWAEYGAALGLEDQYDLADEGVYGTLDDVERDIVAFFDRYELGAESESDVEGRAEDGEFSDDR